ncbi:hypothetical protein COO60DRAFT_1487739 [Scenedesmus sp. NREL 46B-D3]|nr:hypothetical protein COO60DRAFT_1487739 [Scenedesmus sp. NREL 46B-D3]
MSNAGGGYQPWLQLGSATAGPTSVRWWSASAAKGAADWYMYSAGFYNHCAGSSSSVVGCCVCFYLGTWGGQHAVAACHCATGICVFVSLSRDQRRLQAMLFIVCCLHFRPTSRGTLLCELLCELWRNMPLWWYGRVVVVCFSPGTQSCMLASLKSSAECQVAQICAQSACWLSRTDAYLHLCIHVIAWYQAHTRMLWHAADETCCHLRL